MGYLEGFGVTVKKWFGVHTDTGRRVTMQYPEQTRPKPERFHGRHVLNRYDDGMEKCIGCELCAGVCPAKCIYVRGQDNDPDDPTSPGERFGFVYEINYLRCIHCDLCVEACPTEAITETKLFEFAFTNRADAIYTKDELLVGDDGRPQQLPWENWDGGFDPAQQSSGWMRATSPSGDADFVGIVAWAGELGYGVRAPEGTGAEAASADDHGHDDHAHGHDDHGHDAHAHDAHEAEPVAAATFDAATFDAADAEVPDTDAADADATVPESMTKDEPTPLLVDAGPDSEPGPADADDVEDATDEATSQPVDRTETTAEATPDEAVKEPGASTIGFFDAPEEPDTPAKGRRRFGRGKGDRS